MKKLLILPIFLMAVVFFSASTYAISLDGKFNDWTDKPNNSDTIGDAPKEVDITSVSWYPNTTSNEVYFKLSRSGMVRSNNSWNSTIEITYGGVVYKLSVSATPQNRNVDVVLRDASSTYLWNAKGKWCDNLNVEFYVPLSYIFNVTSSGYSIDTKVISGSDVAPDSGSIVISTISTYPIYTVIGAILILVFIKFRRKLRWVR